MPIYDYQTAKEYAELLLNAQVVVSVFGALSWAFGGNNMITFGFTLFAIVALGRERPAPADVHHLCHGNVDYGRRVARVGGPTCTRPR